MNDRLCEHSHLGDAVEPHPANLLVFAWCDICGVYSVAMCDGGVHIVRQHITNVACQKCWFERQVMQSCHVWRICDLNAIKVPDLYPNYRAYRLLHRFRKRHGYEFHDAHTPPTRSGHL